MMVRLARSSVPNASAERVRTRPDGDAAAGELQGEHPLEVVRELMETVGV
jgi:hypothetical protein